MATESLTKKLQEKTAKIETPTENTTPAKVPAVAQPTVFDLLAQMGGEIAKHNTVKDVDRYLRICKTMLQLKPEVLACEPYSILGAIMTASEWGLEPNTLTGECSIIPRGVYDKAGNLIASKAVFQPGYQGWILLSELVPELDEIPVAYEVYKGDKYEVSLGTNVVVTHERASFDERGDVVGYYAIIKEKNGRIRHTDKSVKAIREMVKKDPKVFNSKAWHSSGTDFDEKCKGHLITIILKYYRGKMRKYAQLEDKVRYFDPNNPIAESSEIDLTDYEEVNDNRPKEIIKEQSEMEYREKEYREKIQQINLSFDVNPEIPTSEDMPQ